jgi:small GTP-binding protein
MSNEPIIQKKVCLLGGHAVGKTSLAARFVKSIFSEKYHTSIGVKIDKKVVRVGSNEVKLMIWDMAGEDEFGAADISYLRGTSGYLLVMDGTRRTTFDRGIELQERAEQTIGPVPFVVLINKSDLSAEWEISDHDVEELAQRGWTVYRTSAKTGASVEESFHALAKELLDHP